MKRGCFFIDGEDDAAVILGGSEIAYEAQHGSTVPSAVKFRDRSQEIQIQVGGFVFGSLSENADKIHRESPTQDPEQAKKEPHQRQPFRFIERIDGKRDADESGIAADAKQIGSVGAAEGIQHQLQQHPGFFDGRIRRQQRMRRKRLLQDVQDFCSLSEIKFFYLFIHDEYFTL